MKCEVDVEERSSSKGGCIMRSLNVDGLSREGLKAISGGVMVWWLVVGGRCNGWWWWLSLDGGEVKWEAGQSS